MSQAVTIRQPKSERDWERVKYLLDKAAPVATSPVFLLIGGFVLSNYLQHTHMAYVTKHTTGHWEIDLNPSLIFPFLTHGIKWIPDETDVIDMTFITDQQADLLRTGLVAAAALPNITDIIKAVKL